MRLKTATEGTLGRSREPEIQDRIVKAERDAKTLAEATLAGLPSASTLARIAALESAITPRRLREALFGDIESGAFVAVLNNAIDDLRRAN